MQMLGTAWWLEQQIWSCALRCRFDCMLSQASLQVAGTSSRHIAAALMVAVCIAAAGVWHLLLAVDCIWPQHIGA